MFGFGVKTINSDELRKKIANKEKMIIIDVCEPYEYDEYKIENAINMPLLDFPELFKETFPKINKNEQIIVYCAHGIRSNRAFSYLKSLGFTNIYSLKGGIADYLNLDF